MFRNYIIKINMIEYFSRQIIKKRYDKKLLKIIFLKQTIKNPYDTIFVKTNYQKSIRLILNQIIKI